MVLFYLGGDSSSEISENDFNDREIEIFERLNEYKTVCKENKQIRDIETLLKLYQSENGVNQLSDIEIMFVVERKHISSHNLENVLGDEEKGVSIRRKIIEESAGRKGVLESVPLTHFPSPELLVAITHMPFILCLQCINLGVNFTSISMWTRI